MSSALPYMQLYVADYLADTTHLSTLEHGAYLLLLMNYWQRGEPLDADDKKLARISQLSVKDWLKIKDIIAELFVAKEGRWTQKRIERELNIAYAHVEQRRNAGKASAQRRADERANEKPTKTQRAFNERPEIPEQNREEQKREEPPVVPQEGDDKLTEALSVFNVKAAANGWPQVEKFSSQRKARLKARLKDCGGLSGWIAALEKASKAPWLNGENDRGWRCDFDFLTSDSKFTKLMEGGYDERQKPNGKHSSRDSIEQAIEFRRFRDAQQGGGDSGDEDCWPLPDKGPA